MKKILTLLLSIVLGLFAFVACGDGEGSSSPGLGLKYNIAYYAVVDGAETASEVPQDAWIEDGKYPTSYSKETIISNLKTSYTVTIEDQEGVMAFGGWYLDKACTQAFTGITAQTTGDITLYAKLTFEITYTESSITYKMVVRNAVEDIFEDMFKKNGNYPTSYVEGKSVLLIDDLKKEYQTFNSDGSGDDYTFKGWYVDEACTTAFTGITEETKGDVVLYAKVTYAFWSPSV